MKLILKIDKGLSAENKASKDIWKCACLENYKINVTNIVGLVILEDRFWVTNRIIIQNQDNGFQ